MDKVSDESENGQKGKRKEEKTNLPNPKVSTYRWMQSINNQKQWIWSTVLSERLLSWLGQHRY